MHERARREVNGQGNPEAVLGHALGGSLRKQLHLQFRLTIKKSGH